MNYNDFDYSYDYNENIDSRMSHMPQNSDLIATIEECEATCEHMTTFLKKKYKSHERVLQQRLLRDCADICGLTSKYIARNSPFSRMIANLCACICQRCGMECSRFPDTESQECARICLHCAKECQAFAMGY